ncbi:hypothetical protein [Falsiroseomonas sp. E2-1-a4]|uniref:hypothetical protein n=1 Tax=Falsiroseomonas sp. E2-1-a4 TaxID=3239299 RepID=UPI003F4103DD
MAEINAAYDVLKREQWALPADGISSRDPRIKGVCVWAWAGHPAKSSTVPDDQIKVANERDLNFLKRHIWQASGRSKEEWTIWSFDGRRFLPSFTVYGAAHVFGEMAAAALCCARVGFRRPRAVFVEKGGGRWVDLLLIYSDGIMFPAIPFNRSFDGPPSNDQALLSKLPAMLDDLTSRSVAS